MRQPASLSSVLFAALLALPAAAQDGGDRINFSKPTDKVNKVEEQRPSLGGERRDLDLSGSSPSDAAAMPPTSSPSLSRAQVDALKKLQAGRDWALQDLIPAGETGSAGLEDGGRMGIDDLFDKPRAGSPPARREDNAGESRGALDARPFSEPTALRPMDAPGDFSPRARSILDGDTLFEKGRRTQRPGAFGEADRNIPGTTAQTPARRRSEQRVLDFRKMLNTSVFDPSGQAADNTPGLTGLDTPGLNSELNTAGAGRAGRSGPLADQQPNSAREDAFLGGVGVSAIGPRTATLPDFGRTPGDAYDSRRQDSEPASPGTPTVKIPTFEMPKRRF